MKVAIACFVEATTVYLQENSLSDDCSISFLITGDEEAAGINGTKKLLQYIYNKSEKLTACIVGEPTNPNQVGDMIKIGRRGSITFNLTIQGVQGHVAYPDLAKNPINPMIDILNELKSAVFDNGNEFFDPTNLEITTIDVGNSAN